MLGWGKGGLFTQGKLKAGVCVYTVGLCMNKIYKQIPILRNGIFTKFSNFMYGSICLL